MELLKKAKVYDFGRLMSAKRFLSLLMIITFSILSGVAAVAEQPARERKIDVHFTDYEDLYFSILDLTAGPEDDAQFESLTEPAQAMYIVAILDMEVQNGGLCQFFVNCGSAYAARTISSLQTIGLEPMGILYESFLLDHQIDPTELSSFQIDTAEEFITQYERYPFDEFDNAYMDLWESLDFEKVMLQYANDHSEAFFHN